MMRYGTYAELTPNRKNAQCPECHRLLAVRSRDSDGRHRLYLDADWRSDYGGSALANARKQAAFDRQWGIDHGVDLDPDDDRRADFRRPWQRRDTGARHRHGDEGQRRLVTGRTRLDCGCGRIVILEDDLLDVTFEPGQS